MKFLILLVVVCVVKGNLYHYQECLRGTTVLLTEPCSPATYEGNSPYHPLADNKFAVTCINNQFSFVCQDGTKHTYHLSARRTSPKLFVRKRQHSEDLHTPIFLIVFTLLFLILCFKKW
ncbi:ORF7a protein [Bat SARS-like coronavirus Khosta-2]|nr:ORF7a protein [Bat SARS-like coronavirus Khosta-2]